MITHLIPMHMEEQFQLLEGVYRSLYSREAIAIIVN
jgi:hypothetical protein